MSAVRALILGGTSEGRELAEFASEHQVPVLVSVVSEYGESLIGEDPCVQVRRGALEMCIRDRYYPSGRVSDCNADEAFHKQPAGEYKREHHAD